MRPSVRSRVFPVARPKYFLAAPLAASALWPIFLPMLIADSLALDDHVAPTAGGQHRPGNRCLPWPGDMRGARRLSTAREATEQGNPVAAGRRRLRHRRATGRAGL